MPTLDWIGKSAVLNHHREVPFHLLEEVPELSVGDPDAGNLLVQGDNLLALKALLPHYAGKVKCIYIDPPYNTGNENWVYNDAVNSPEMRDWLGKVVGAEAEDLTRHDKWLCMMYPRLQLLREFLSHDGALFVSIDDKEQHHLRLLLDEIFGANNFVATVVWQKVYSPKNSARHLSEDHDYIVIYARDAARWRPNLMSRSEKQDKAYKNRDNDPRGPWKTSDLSARNFYSKGTYAITTPAGREVPAPPTGMYWRVSEENFKGLVADNRIWWGRRGDAIPQIKRFLSDVKQGVVPQTLWSYKEVGHTQEAKKELISLVEFASSDDVFVTPKPVRLMRRILEIGAEKDSLIMDSFAGSATMGQAVLEANREDGGSRKFVLIEMDTSVGRDIAQHRLRKVVEGYRPLLRDGDVARVDGTGGGFRYFTIGNTLADMLGEQEDRFTTLASHIFFSETGEAVPPGRRSRPPLVGHFRGTDIYLLLDGIRHGDSTADPGVLTASALASLRPGNGRRVVYGTGCRLGEARLKRERITFKQIPYDIRLR